MLVNVLFRSVLAATLITLLSFEALAAKKWKVKPDCTLIENKSNDGDSFHVRVKKRHYIFRLYWVDAPETDMGTPERVAEQAMYFGITQAAAVEAGKEAKKFAEEFLSGTFTVHTKFADAMGRSTRDRDYAIIEKDGKYLHQELVAAGLARIHGLQQVSEDMPNEQTMRSRLTFAESEAKKAKRGAWGKGAGGPGSSFTSDKPLPKEVTLSRSLAVLDPDNASKQLGILRSGSQVEILGKKTPTLIHIRFKVGDGTREGLCQRASLGI